MQNFLITILALLLTLIPSKVFSEESQSGQGKFVICTKSNMAIFLDGKIRPLRAGQSEPCEVKVGSTIIVRYKSKFTYNGGAAAFVFQDRTHWIPFERTKMKLIPHAPSPKDVTTEMINKASSKPVLGRPGSDFIGNWKRFDLPNINRNNWLGVKRKNTWETFAFIVTEDMIRPLKSNHRPQPPAPSTAETTPKAPPAAQILTQEELAGVVIIEGDQGVGSGFLTKMNGNLYVVTNLHVLGNNTKFTIKTLAGNNVRVDVKSLKAAVGADIALLGIAEGQDELTPLISSSNVLETTKIGNKIVVIGNRLGGGVATQTIGNIRGIGPSQIEVDAKFQSGNSGSPIYDIESKQIVGVASYTQTISADQIAGDNLKKLNLKNETRWFGYRIDTVKKWQSLTWGTWRKQITSMEEYHDTSMSALEVLKGNLSIKYKDARIQRLVTDFRKQKGRLGHNHKTAELFTSIARYLKDRKLSFSRLKFYNYFHTCPYWETSLPQQNVFRDRLIEAFSEASERIKK